MRGRMQAILKYLFLSILGAALYVAGAKIAYEERGYFAVGGEVFALFLPAFYYIVSSMIRDVIAEYCRPTDSAVSDKDPKK